MINFCLVFVTSLIAIVSFCNVYRYNGISRTVFQVDKSLLATTLIYVEHGDDYSLYFNEIELEKTINTFYETNLKKYISTYQVTFSYIDQESGKISFSEYKDAVKVRLYCDIGLGIVFDKESSFFIKRNEIII